MITTVSGAWIASRTGVLTGLRVGPFFEFVDHRIGANTQHPCGVPNPAAIECHFDNLSFRCWQPPLITVVKLKYRAAALHIVTAITLRTVRLFTGFNHIETLAAGTLNRNRSHR